MKVDDDVNKKRGIEMTRTFIKLGELKRDKREFTIIKTKESEKAIQIQILEKIERLGKVREFTRTEWLPKSQIQILGEYIAVEGWLAKQKQLPAFEIIYDGSFADLEEYKKLDNPQARVQALQEGRAHMGNWINC